MDVASPATRTLPVVDAAGTPRERGRAHGEELRPLIGAGIDRWATDLGTAHGLDPDDYLRDFLGSTGYLATAARWTPDLLDEVRGIAEGARMPFERVAAYNLLDEEWAYARSRRTGTSAPGCTVVGLRQAGTGIPVLAQTMDIPSLHDGTQAVLRLASDQGPTTLAFTYAGMIGLNGCNEEGVAVVVNNLAMLASSTLGLPVAFVVRGVLGCATLAAAAAFLRGVPHAIGQHYAIGAPDGFVSLECSASGVTEDAAAGDRVLHTNHPLVSADLTGDPEPLYAGSRTRERYAYLREHGPTLADREAAERALADTSVPVSLGADRRSMTFGAISVELTVPPRLRVAPGPPHQTPFVDVGFAAGSAARAA